MLIVFWLISGDGEGSLVSSCSVDYCWLSSCGESLTLKVHISKEYVSVFRV